MVPVMPTATLQQQLERRQAIARLLDEHEIYLQSELVELLRAEGYPATQSSVSRDLRNLGAAKLRNRYSLPERVAGHNEQPLEVIGQFVRDIRPAGPNLLVISTAVGAAQRVALTLDRVGWPEIVGTLSGDDTIFVATASAARQRRLSSMLRQCLSEAAQ